MSLFDQLIERVLKNEGGYSFNAKDPGGETNWGITLALARAYGYTSALRDMTRDQAKAIYKVAFWDRCHADDMPGVLPFLALDFAVNSGIETAIRKLQLALRIADDGHWGPISRSTALSCDPGALALRYIAQRQRYQASLSTWGTFGKGWANRNADDMDYAAMDLDALIINTPQGKPMETDSRSKLAINVANSWKMNSVQFIAAFSAIATVFLAWFQALPADCAPLLAKGAACAMSQTSLLAKFGVPAAFVPPIGFALAYWFRVRPQNLSAAVALAASKDAPQPPVDFEHSVQMPDIPSASDHTNTQITN